MYSAFRISDALIASHLNLVTSHGRRTQGDSPRIGEAEIEVIAARFRVRGELGLRELVRTFHDRKTCDVERMVAAALDAGVLQQAGNKFRLADSGEMPQ